MFLKHEIMHEKVFFSPSILTCTLNLTLNFCGRKRAVAPTPFLVQQSESQSSRVPSLHSKIGMSTITTSTKTSLRPRLASGVTTASEPLNLQPRTMSQAMWTPLKPSRRLKAHQVGAAHNVMSGCLLRVVKLMGQPLRYIHPGRAQKVFDLVPDQLLQSLGGVCRPVRLLNAADTGIHSLLW
jgi:hypothetical protein